MYAKLMCAAIAVLCCAGAYAEEDIVYQNDWRAGETGYVTGDHVRKNTRESVSVRSVPTIGYHTGQPDAHDDLSYPGRGYQENRDDQTYPGRGFQQTRDGKTYPGRGFQENRDDRSFPGRGFQESHDDRW